MNGPTASDVRQGRDGDCWFMAALCTLSNKKGLIDNISVARNEKVGVYGFVFFRGRYIGFIIYYLIFFSVGNNTKRGMQTANGSNISWTTSCTYGQPITTSRLRSGRSGTI